VHQDFGFGFYNLGLQACNYQAYSKVWDLFDYQFYKGFIKGQAVITSKHFIFPLLG